MTPAITEGIKTPVFDDATLPTDFGILAAETLSSLMLQSICLSPFEELQATLETHLATQEVMHLTNLTPTLGWTSENVPNSEPDTLMGSATSPETSGNLLELESPPTLSATLVTMPDDNYPGRPTSAPGSRTPLKKLRCKYCKNYFNNPTMRGLQFSCKNMIWFPCTLCKTKLAGGYSLKRHMAKAHKQM